MAAISLKGVLTALVTPFEADGRIAEKVFVSLVERQIAAGVHGLVPCGTTGETPAFGAGEWERVVRLTIETVNGRLPVVPGTGSNNTAMAVAQTQRARELGADAALVVTPYYNKPNASGLIAHYEKIAQAVDLPIVVYNVPSRTGLNVVPELLGKIATIPGVVAVKEAAGNFSQVMTILRERRAGFAVLSGEDELTCAMTLMGGEGVISVVSNVDPEGTVAMVEAALQGDAKTARSVHNRLLPLMRALFLETNPVPAKAALAELGLAGETVRPPLGAAAPATRQALVRALELAGLGR